MPNRPVTETEYADHLAAMAEREARDRAEWHDEQPHIRLRSLFVPAILLLAYYGCWLAAGALVAVGLLMLIPIPGGRK